MAPYFLFKDLITIFLFIIILSVFVFFMPNYLGDSDNYVMANPMQTPPAIVPEWYLLPFYAILRSIPVSYTHLQEKDSVFECGFHSFLGQNRTQFSISFFIFALLFLLFDLEILLVYPYVVSAYANSIYGLIIMLVFFLALTLGFVYELGKNALKIDSRQMIRLINQKTSITGTCLLYTSYI